MINQKLPIDLFNFPSKQAPQSSINRSKNFGFYLPCANLKKSPEKLLSNYRKNSRIHKQIENFSHNQSKYECSNKVDDLNSNTNNSVYFNEKNGIHTIKFKQNLEASKNENDDSLNFTYFSKEIALINEKKHEGYLVLKDFLSPFKKKTTNFLRKTFKNKKSNLPYNKNNSNIQTSNNSKKLPEISKDNEVNTSKETNNMALKSHKKTKAIDYKQYNLLPDKKDVNSSKISTENTTQITQNLVTLDHLSSEGLNKSKMTINFQDDKKSHRRLSFIEMKKPLSPKSVIKDFSHLLGNYEKSEILTYKEIFYLSSTVNNTSNGNFEDKRGYYNAIAGDHINFRYEIKEEMGKGTFGKVFKVYDHKKEQEFALKIMKKDKVYYTQALNEVKILNYIKEKDSNHSSNIVKIINYFMFRNHVCIVFELLSVSLYSFMKANKFNGISLDLIRKISIQLFQTLSFLYKHKIIHCDLKPENILLKNINKSGIKLIDMGSSCFANSRCFSYIQSRYYRSPEILFGYDYGLEIDIWSMGCILAELYLGTPLFPGESEGEMVFMICEILGLPELECLKKSRKKNKFFDFKNDETFFLKNSLVKNQREPSSKKLKEIINDNEDFINLIENCLVFDPKKRIKPYLALTHPWIVKDLPKEIKSLYLKECEELKDEIENFEKNQEINYIVVEDCPKIKYDANKKATSQEKKQDTYRHPLVEQKFKENFLIDQNKYQKEQKTEKSFLEAIDLKIIEKDPIQLPSDIKHMRNLRKFNYSKKKSITFHQTLEQDPYFN